LRENVEGSENFALSGVVEDSLYTFDAWTNATGGADYYPLHISVNVWKRTA
jgi:hypothetical protein